MVLKNLDIKVLNDTFFLNRHWYWAVSLIFASAVSIIEIGGSTYGLRKNS